MVQEPHLASDAVSSDAVDAVSSDAMDLDELSQRCKDAHWHSIALAHHARWLMLRAQNVTVRSFDLCVEAQYLCEDRKYDRQHLATGPESICSPAA